MKTIFEQLGLSQDLPMVRMELIGADGNAFSIMGRFKKEARKAGWDSDSITKLLDHCKSGDYNNLLATIASVVEDISTDKYDYYNDDDDDYGNDYDDDYDVPDVPLIYDNGVDYTEWGR